MKASCPHCHKKFKAPDEWAGRKVKCPACKHPVALPSGSESDTDLGFDLGSLEMMEQVGETVVRERSKTKPMTLKEARAAATATQEDQPAAPIAPSDPTIRQCPNCGKVVSSKEIYSDLICSNCNAPIPGQEIKQEKVLYTKLSDRITVNTTFYTGFSSAAFYPLPAMGSIGLAMAIALAAIALPVFPILAFSGAANQNEVAQQTSFGWVGTAFTGMFAAEALFFGAVAYFVMLDTIRTTTSGTEQPPPLTWSPTKLGGAMGGYVALLAFYAAGVALLFMIRKGSMPSSMADFQPFVSDPINLLFLALLMFAVPMNLIGLSSTEAVDGLNPVRFGASIGKTIGHYSFLFLLVLLFVGFYVGIMFAVMSWAGPMIVASMKRSSDDTGLGKVMLTALMGLGAWSVLIGLALYFAYAMGRVLGLFSRTYRDRLSFEL